MRIAGPLKRDQNHKLQREMQATEGLVAVAGIGMIAARCCKSTCSPHFLCYRLLIISLLTFKTEGPYHDSCNRQQKIGIRSIDVIVAS